jgi:hypothetical protein
MPPADAVLFVLATTLARRGEKAKWIAQPTWPVYPLAILGAFVHRRDITSNRLRRDMVIAIVVTAGRSGRS